MMRSLCIFALLATAVLAQPPRPNPPETFEGHTEMEVRVNTTDGWQSFFGHGWYAVNQPKGQGVQEYIFEGYPEYDMFVLERFDLGFTYDIEASNKTHCNVHAVNHTFPPVWGWLSQATYKGEIHHHMEKLDLWELTLGYATVGLAVRASSPNTPVWFRRKSPTREVNVYFQRFWDHVPAPYLFNVPPACEKAELVTAKAAKEQLSCVARSTMISRGQSWVDAHVPYNQGGYYGGYREDCSGFVSMCWETSKPGYVTSTLPQIAHQISSGSLMPGDVLLDVSEHVVLFAGWADGSHSHYIAMEETRPGEGTVKRTTPYPYWYNQAAFKPYRFNSVC
jgi:hypothetical protein